MDPTPSTTRSRFGPFARMPIGAKLPLAAGALVLVVTAAMGYAAHEASRQALLDTARQRQTQVAKSFANMLGRASATAYRAQVAGMAKKPALRAYLQQPESADRFSALDALEFTSTSRIQDTQVVAMELVSASGTVLLATGREASLARTIPGRSELPWPVKADSAMLGHYRLVGDRIVFPVVSRVGDGEPAGFIVMWRRVQQSADTRQLISDLVGTSGKMLFGNDDGSVWHDIGAPIDGPRILPTTADTTVTYRRPGVDGELVGKVLQLDGSPWAVLVEFPRDTILAPLAGFTRRLAMISLVALSASLLLAWLLSRRLTRPLGRLTAAAQAISSGEEQRIGMERSDELGTLAGAFDRMSERVSEARHRLEERVAERTEELNAALLQLHHAQEALVRREKLATLGQLASSVGHELRNPLGVMSNAVYYLEMVQADAPDNVREYLGILREQVNVSGKIINDLLDFSRISTAQRQDVALHTVTEVQLAQIAIPANIAVIHCVPEDLPHAHVDPVHAGQVVFNLVTNAVQAMGAEGGTLTVQAFVNGDDRVHLQVRDTGPGIAPENLDRIFEPLFTTKARGIGLGLAVSRSLAQVNDGELSCESVPGAGTTFTLTLRAAREVA